MSSRIATSHVAPNILNRQFKAHGARKVLLTDITYIPRRKAHESDSLRFSYLSVIMDAYTKQVLAWVLSLSLEVDFVLETVQQLMDKHGDELKTDVMMHSDQGGHYKSTKFIEIMQSKRLRQSMSRKANCWDNAPQESLFGHMKSEIHLNPSDNHTEIEAKIADWMDYYNNERYQWSLMKLSPNEFYRYTKTGEYPLPGEPPAQLEGGEETDDLD
jgi:transposase InsO family protein